MTNFGGLVELWGVGADGREWVVWRTGPFWNAVVKLAVERGMSDLSTPAAALAWVREVCG